MCVWCDKQTKLEPQVSGVKVPMICTECGTRVCAYGWSELRDMFNAWEERVEQAEKRIKFLEKELERKM